MTDRTFRAVVAAVLVGALALAVVVVFVLLPRSTEPAPSASPTTSPVPTASPVPTPVPTIAPTASAGPAFVAPEVVSVGLVPRGASSSQTLVLKFVESSVDAIPNAPGSFRLTLTDQAGDGSTVAFVGTASVDAPGSLGATARLVAPNVLMVSIEGADIYNLEPITINGLGISASSTAAIGALNAELGGFTGSLVTGAAGNVLASPGSVIAGS